MKIYLDDTRKAPKGFKLVKSYKECIRLLKTKQVEEISLDHDLGGSKTGNDIILWIEEQCFLSDDYNPPKISIHSANPVGVLKMKAGIENIIKIKGD